MKTLYIVRQELSNEELSFLLSDGSESYRIKAQSVALEKYEGKDVPGLDTSISVDPTNWDTVKSNDYKSFYSDLIRLLSGDEHFGASFDYGILGLYILSTFCFQLFEKTGVLYLQVDDAVKQHDIIDFLLPLYFNGHRVFPNESVRPLRWLTHERTTTLVFEGTTSCQPAIRRSFLYGLNAMNRVHISFIKSAEFFSSYSPRVVISNSSPPLTMSPFVIELRKLEQMRTQSLDKFFLSHYRITALTLVLELQKDIQDEIIVNKLTLSPNSPYFPLLVLSKVLLKHEIISASIFNELNAELTKRIDIMKRPVQYNLEKEILRAAWQYALDKDLHLVSEPWIPTLEFLKILRNEQGDLFEKGKISARKLISTLRKNRVIKKNAERKRITIVTEVMVGEKIKTVTEDKQMKCHLWDIQRLGELVSEKN
jgi:hypothetical protein